MRYKAILLPGRKNNARNDAPKKGRWLDKLSESMMLAYQIINRKEDFFFGKERNL